MGHPKFLAQPLVPCVLRGPDKSLITSKRIPLFKKIPPAMGLGSILGTEPEGKKIKFQLALSDVTFLLPLRVVICYCEEQTNELNKMCSGEFS